MDDDKIILNFKKMGIPLSKVCFIETKLVIGTVFKHVIGTFFGDIEGSSPPNQRFQIFFVIHSFPLHMVIQFISC